MKKLVQIGCIAMVGYLLALPILFVVHNVIHHHAVEHYCEETPSSEYERTDDCGVCDVFLNQQFFHQQTAQLVKTGFIVERWMAKEVKHDYFRLTEQFNRGPPIG